jgi:hypothetical protein
LHALVLQEFWWYALATCSKVMAEQNALFADLSPVHPCVRRLAACCRPAYAAKILSRSMAYPELSMRNLELVHVLLLRELWELLPWQVLQLEGVGGVAVAAAAAAGGEAANAACSAGGGSEGSGSSDTSKGGEGSSEEEEEAVDYTEAMWRTAHIHLDIPLLPQHGMAAHSSRSSSSGGSGDSSSSGGGGGGGSSSSNGGRGGSSSGGGDRGASTSGCGSSSPAAPVTLEQLQVVTSAMYLASMRTGYPAALLLTLLLQRADPGVRADFLSSPMGSLMRHALCQMAWDHDKTLGIGWLVSVATATTSEARAQLAAVLNKVPLQQQPLGLWRMSSVTASLLVLIWSHLVVGPPSELWRRRPEAPGPWTVLATVGTAQNDRVAGLGEPAKECSCCTPHIEMQQAEWGWSQGAKARGQVGAVLLNMSCFPTLHVHAQHMVACSEHCWLRGCWPALLASQHLFLIYYKPVERLKGGTNGMLLQTQYGHPPQCVLLLTTLLLERGTDASALLSTCCCRVPDDHSPAMCRLPICAGSGAQPGAVCSSGGAAEGTLIRDQDA